MRVRVFKISITFHPKTAVFPPPPVCPEGSGPVQRSVDKTGQDRGKGGGRARCNDDEKMPSGEKKKIKRLGGGGKKGQSACTARTHTRTW